MDLSADQFLECIKKGESVTGSRIRGRLIINSDFEIRQSDWSDCRFDSSIELNGCMFLCNASMGRQGAAAVLDLSGARVDGRVHVNGVRLSGQCSTSSMRVDIRLHGAEVHGELLVLASLDGAPMSLDFRNAVVAGQILAKGSIQRVDGRDATIGAHLGIQLRPVRLWQEGAEENSASVAKSVAIDVSRASVSGDVRIVPDDKAVNEVFTRPEHEDGVPLDFDILVILDAERLRVGGDFLLGIPVSDNSEASKWPAVLTHGVNLRRAEVSGEVTLRCVRMIGVEPLDENLHLYVGVAARKLRCGGLIIANLVFEIDIQEGTSIDQGEIVRLVELDDAEIKGNASLWRIRGRIHALPDTWSGPSVLGISMARMECESLNLTTPTIVYLDEGKASLLPIEADEVKVLDTAVFGLREKLDAWSSVDLGDAFERIEQALGSELIPDASAQGAVIGSLELEADPPMKEKLDLTGAQVGKWRIGSGGHEEENSPNYLALLRATKGFDAGLYLAVEKRLEDIGKRRDADDVHVAWQRRRRKERIFFQSKPQWFLSWLHDAALGYGTRTWRPLFVIMAAFVVSTFLAFAYHDQWIQVSAQTYSELASCGAPCEDRVVVDLGEKDPWPRARDSAALSVRNLIPVIDLQIAPGLEPIPGSPGSFWFLMLRMIGIVAWPVLLAGSLARIIHKRNLG